MSDDPIVVVGGGQAAVQLCLALRKQKVDTPVLILSDEARYPYHRPPLSKSYLTGETDDDSLSMRPTAFYESKDIAVKLGSCVTKIDPQAKTLTTNEGVENYQSLVIATGARPRPLPLAGADIQGVHLLRSFEQARRLKAELNRAKHIVVVGGGFIGLEFAAAANVLKKHVTVFDTADRVMARAVAPAISSWFEKTHRSNGIDIRLQESISELHGSENIEKITTASGETMRCDLLVVGIGVIPNIEFAQAAGIECENGIVVNEFCETSMPFVYAAGDCANHSNPFFNKKMIRLESIQNATDQARVVASAIAGNKQAYVSIPWFWSDQGSNSLQMAGLSDAPDQYVLRSAESGNDSFSVFHFREGRLMCADSVNSPREHILARKLISAGISPTTAQVADSKFDLKSLLG